MDQTLWVMSSVIPLRDGIAAVLRDAGYPVSCPTAYGAALTGCLDPTCAIAIIDMDFTAPAVGGQLARAARRTTRVRAGPDPARALYGGVPDLAGQASL